MRTGQDNVVAVLVENTGNPEGPTGEKTGLYSASADRLGRADHLAADGCPGGITLQDPVRGVMNAAGLYGSRQRLGPARLPGPGLAAR